VKLSTVDPIKYPSLYAALKRGTEAIREGWQKVSDLRQAGHNDAANRLARKLLGVQGEPMSEETKEKLRRYNEEHKEEIQERRKQERATLERTKALLRTGNKGRK
jgi:hypothetical protein